VFLLHVDAISYRATQDQDPALKTERLRQCLEYLGLTAGVCVVRSEATWDVLPTVLQCATTVLRYCTPDATQQQTLFGGFLGVLREVYNRLSMGCSAAALQSHARAVVDTLAALAQDDAVVDMDAIRSVVALAKVLKQHHCCIQQEVTGFFASASVALLPAQREWILEAWFLEIVCVFGTRSGSLGPECGRHIVAAIELVATPTVTGHTPTLPLTVATLRCVSNILQACKTACAVSDGKYPPQDGVATMWQCGDLVLKLLSDRGSAPPGCRWVTENGAFYSGRTIGSATGVLIHTLTSLLALPVLHIPAVLRALDLIRCAFVFNTCTEDCYRDYAKCVMAHCTPADPVLPVLLRAGAGFPFRRFPREYMAHLSEDCRRVELVANCFTRNRVKLVDPCHSQYFRCRVLNGAFKASHVLFGREHCMPSVVGEVAVIGTGEVEGEGWVELRPPAQSDWATCKTCMGVTSGAHAVKLKQCGHVHHVQCLVLQISAVKPFTTGDVSDDPPVLCMAAGCTAAYFF